VNEFVEQCRREWRRLRVPRDIANDMATELAADLEQAEAEGVPPEELLGRAAGDPRSFASAWAEERGAGRRLPPPSRRASVFAAFVVFVALAIGGTALTLFGSPSRSVIAAGPALWIRPPTATTVTLIRAPALAEMPSNDDTRTLGKVFLIVGLAGTAALSLPFLWRRSVSPYGLR
jgi:hypothetical protein